MQVSAKYSTISADRTVVMTFFITQPLQLKERLGSISQECFAQMNFVAAEKRVGMIAGVRAKTIRFGEPRRCLPRDLLALKHGCEIQEVQARQRLNVALRVMWIAYLTSQHLEPSAYSQERLAGCRVRFNHPFPSVLPEPKQIRDCVLAAGQDQHIGGACFFRAPRVIENHTWHVLQRGKIREVGKVRQPDHTHAQTILAVEWRSHRPAFERNTIFIVYAVIAEIRDNAET